MDPYFIWFVVSILQVFWPLILGVVLASYNAFHGKTNLAKWFLLGGFAIQGAWFLLGRLF